LKVALAASLRLGESVRCAERVEGVLEVSPRLVAEGDACYRRTNPPQSPMQSIDWCGMVQTVHPSLSRCNGSGSDGVRLTDVRTRDSAANRLIRASDRVYAPYAPDGCTSAPAHAPARHIRKHELLGDLINEYEAAAWRVLLCMTDFSNPRAAVRVTECEHDVRPNPHANRLTEPKSPNPPRKRIDRK
jgi:hypothetical protein